MSVPACVRVLLILVCLAGCTDTKLNERQSGPGQYPTITPATQLVSPPGCTSVEFHNAILEALEVWDGDPESYGELVVEIRGKKYRLDQLANVDSGVEGKREPK